MTVPNVEAIGKKVKLPKVGVIKMGDKVNWSDGVVKHIRVYRPKGEDTWYADITLDRSEMPPTSRKPL